MSRQRLNWNDLATKARTAPDRPAPSTPEGFTDRLWSSLEQKQLVTPPSRSFRLSGLGWCAAASIALAITIVGFNLDLFELTHEPNSPLVDELVVSDWTALDAAL
jgi:hypothetical protein